MRTAHQAVMESAGRQQLSARVLLVDENIQDLNSGAALLEQLGFEVYRCSSYETAVCVVEREDFEFAVVDQGSPAFDGLPVLKHLTRFSPSTPFIVIATFKDIACYLEALEIGALDYFEKPMPAQAMRRLIGNRLVSTASRVTEE